MHQLHFSGVFTLYTMMECFFLPFFQVFSRVILSGSTVTCNEIIWGIMTIGIHCKKKKTEKRKEECPSRITVVPCVFDPMCLFCCLNAYPCPFPRHMMWADEKTELDWRTEEKNNAWVVLGSQTSPSRPPPPNPPVNHRGRPTSDLLCLSGILIGSPAAHVDCSFTVCLSLWHTHRNTHTHNKHTLLPVCVWFYDRSSEDFLGLFLCFLFFFFLLFFVLHGRSELLWQRVFQKRF